MDSSDFTGQSLYSAFLDIRNKRGFNEQQLAFLFIKSLAKLKKKKSKFLSRLEKDRDEIFIKSMKKDFVRTLIDKMYKESYSKEISENKIIELNRELTKVCKEKIKNEKSIEGLVCKFYEDKVKFPSNNGSKYELYIQTAIENLKDLYNVILKASNKYVNETGVDYGRGVYWKEYDAIFKALKDFT